MGIVVDHQLPCLLKLIIECLDVFSGGRFQQLGLLVESSLQPLRRLPQSFGGFASHRFTMCFVQLVCQQRLCFFGLFDRLANRFLELIQRVRLFLQLFVQLVPSTVAAQASGLAGLIHFRQLLTDCFFFTEQLLGLLCQTLDGLAIAFGRLTLQFVPQFLEGLLRAASGRECLRGIVLFQGFGRFLGIAS